MEEVRAVWRVGSVAYRARSLSCRFDVPRCARCACIPHLTPLHHTLPARPATFYLRFCHRYYRLRYARQHYLAPACPHLQPARTFGRHRTRAAAFAAYAFDCVAARRIWTRFACFVFYAGCLRLRGAPP